MTRSYERNYHLNTVATTVRDNGAPNNDKLAKGNDSTSGFIRRYQLQITSDSNQSPTHKNRPHTGPLEWDSAR